MNNFYEQLIIRKQELLNAISIAEEILTSAPPGRLRIAKTPTGAHFFHVTSPDDTCGKYISLSDTNLISQLANKNYAERFLKKANEELSDINVFLKKKSFGKAEEVYTEINQFRKPYISPLLMTDDEYLALWQKKSFPTNPYKPENKIYETDCHEFVRSKSEMNIANLLNQMGIPYRYEAELILPKGGVRYPDFTLLNIKTRETVYYEHFGLLDDSGYRRENLQKIGEYTENGIILGKNLIFTFEAQGSPINLKNIRRMLSALF